MIRSCLLRLVAFLAVLIPLLIIVSWLSQMTHGIPHVALAFPSLSSPPALVSVTQPVVTPVSPSRSVVVPARSTSSGVSVLGGPTLSPAFVDRVLAHAHSPATGTGQALYDLSKQYQIDNAYALAVFAEESSFGRAGVAVETHGLGNIICAGYSTCLGRFRQYSTWQEGYADFYRLLKAEYLPRGLVTVERIVPVYAPSSENDTALYIHNVVRFMRAFRSGKLS